MGSENFVMNLSPVAGSSFRNFVRVFRGNRIEPKYYSRAVSSGAMSLLSEPFRWWEHARYDSMVSRKQISQDPIFILGHWRSGTTYLHNLVCKDPSMGFVNTYQGVYPELLLGSKWLFKNFMKAFIPSKRTSDNMELSADTPQEEEFALVNLNPYSFYNFWLFPKRTQEYYHKYVEYKDVPERVRTVWKNDYIRLMKKALINKNADRFVSKNPANTGRIDILLEMFPNARFIHIYRNPLNVFVSTKKLIENTLPVLQFHDISPHETEENIFWLYERMMKRYIHDKDLIPKGNLAEVRYEFFENHPLLEMERIYSTLKIPGFEKAKPFFEAHIRSQQDYQKNEYTLPKEEMKKILNRWRFAMEHWGYSIPGDLEITGSKKAVGY